jgi:hydrogenase maturation factor
MVVIKNMKTEKSLHVGKLSMPLLSSLLEYNGIKDDKVVLGPKIGEDAAVVDFDERIEKYLVIKTDPITFATKEIGWYVVNVNANDIATKGARPKWFLTTILLPLKTTEENVKKTFSQISEACKELGIAIVGGHTEVTYGLERPIVVGCMLGEVEKDKLVKTSGARVGDDIIITKGIAIEGTSIIAREKEAELKEKGFSSDFIDRCKKFLYQTSIVKDAEIAIKTAEIHCMHDPTEGGLANGLYEIAEASGNGLLIYKDEVPILEESRILCEEYGLNPLGTITSGTLILTLSEKESKKLLEKYKVFGIKAKIIGKIKDKEYGLKILEDGKTKDLEYCEKDEITKILGQS